MRILKKLPLIVGGLILVVALLVSMCVQKSEEAIPTTPITQPKKEFKLSDFPKVFKENTLIIIGDNASEIEIRAAKEIAKYLKNKTGNKPLIKRYSEVTEEDKRSYNLIVIGTLMSNKMLKEIYAIADVLKTNETFPGDCRGILEVVNNPWNKSKAMLLIEGSSKWGVKVSELELLKEKIKENNQKYIIVEPLKMNSTYYISQNLLQQNINPNKKLFLKIKLIDINKLIIKINDDDYNPKDYIFIVPDSNENGAFDDEAYAFLVNGKCFPGILSPNGKSVVFAEVIPFSNFHTCIFNNTTGYTFLITLPIHRMQLNCSFLRVGFVDENDGSITTDIIIAVKGGDIN